jgi:4-coumarate--CoA ligase (photoactive yellow protein activation family)
MRGFRFSRPQLGKITAALVADELARRHQRYTETLVHSGWDIDTVLGSGGIGMSERQAQDCAARTVEFFGHDEANLPIAQGSRIGDWVDTIEGLIGESLTGFTFYPHTQTGEASTRHAADSIFQDASAVASLLSGRKRCLSMVPPHTLLGLISTVLAPNLQHMEVIDARRMTPDGLSESLRFGDLVVATPTLWRYLAATLPEIPANIVGLSFGETFTMDLAQKLRQRNIGVLRELYGSTETGVVAWRDSQSEPFTLFDHWQRDGEVIARQRPDGQDQTIIPMDEVEWDGSSAFRLGPRRDGAVQIGAVNVFPLMISDVIAQHPGVISCEVRLHRRPGALDRLIADIVAAPGLDPDQDMAWAIDEWCREKLRPAERPRIYRFRSQITE